MTITIRFSYCPTCSRNNYPSQGICKTCNSPNKVKHLEVDDDEWLFYPIQKETNPLSIGTLRAEKERILKEGRGMPKANDAVLSPNNYRE